MMTVKKRKDSALGKSPIVHKIADIRGGVSVDVSELTQDYLAAGTPISKPASGKCHVVKYAILQANAANDATTLKVLKGHNFKVGDKVFAVKGGKNYGISAIDTSNSAYDEFTVGTTLGVALTAGDAIYQGVATTGATAGAFLYEPFAIVGTGDVVKSDTNFITDAWIHAVTCGNPLPKLIAEALKNVSNY